MGKLTEEVFNESCCDGGACDTTGQSAKTCGCDPGAGWVCAKCREDAMKDTVPAWNMNGPSWVPDAAPATLQPEVRTVDPTTGGEKGVKLQRFSLIPPEFLWHLAQHYGVGAQKYDPHNWERGYRWSYSLDALERHLTQFKLGEMHDPETGSHHLIAVAWHAAALFIFGLRGLGTDDVTPDAVKASLVHKKRQG
jgi:hypothetical protein